MSNIVALSKQKHAHLRLLKAWCAPTARPAVVPVVAEELANIIAMTPVVFVATNNGYDLVALQALSPSKNLFISPDGKWVGGYMPAWYRCHPLSVAVTQQTPVVCIDLDSDRVTEANSDGSVPIFLEHGQLSERAQQQVEFIQRFEMSRQRLQACIQALKDSDVIAPWHVSLNDDSDEETPLSGLFHINEAKLKALQGAELEQLNQSGALSIAYAQLLSEHRLSGLVKLSNAVAKMQTDCKPVEFDDLFEDDDNLKF